MNKIPCKNTITILLVAVTLIGASLGCGKVRTKRWVKSLEVVASDSANCDCPGAKVFSIRNPGPNARTVKIVDYRRDTRKPTNEVVSKPKRIVLQNGETRKKKSPCSIERKNGVCVVMNVHEVEGVPYPKESKMFSRQIVADLVSDNLDSLGAINDLGHSFACVDRCKNGSGQCFVRDISKSKDIEDAKKVRDLLGDRNPIDDAILIDQIIPLISGQTNVCDRTDIVFKNGQIFNYGSRCDAKGTVAGVNVLDMEVPSNFNAIYEKLGSGNFQLRFRKSMAAPKATVNITGIPNQTLFAHRILYADRSAYIKLAEKNGATDTCLQLKLEP